MASCKDYERFFRQADADGSGELTEAELITMLRQTGFAGSDCQIKAMFSGADTSGDGKVTLDEFLAAMGQVPPQTHREALLRRMFNDFDANKDGTIDRSEVGRFFTSLRGCLSDREVDHYMKRMDGDGDGAVTFDEFLKVMN